MSWTGAFLAIAGFGLFLAGYLCRMVDEQAGRDAVQPGATYDASEPLDELDVARERNLQAMLQVAADAWTRTGEQ